MSFHRICILLCALTMFGCAREKQSAVPTDGKVEGTLTINGKNYPLKYVYTGRQDPDPEHPDDTGFIELLIATEPVSYELMSKLLLELGVNSWFAKENEILKGTSINAFYLYFDPEILKSKSLEGRDARYRGYLLTPDAAFRLSMSEEEDAFDQISFKDGILKAKDKNSWEQSEVVAALQRVEIKADYSLSIEAAVRNETLFHRSHSTENKTWQAALARLPEEGSATGTVTMSQSPIELKYAYSMRQDLPRLGKVITVILTDEPIPKERILFSFERTVPDGSCGLYLHIDDAGKLRESVIRWSSGMSMSETGQFAGKEIRDFSFENGKVSGSVENVELDDDKPKRYAVSFDVRVRE